ncbi:MAG: polymerase sigma factor [Gemmataceae bacterium]|nr:polymerase sigma factor [Gemmataceae bacterium]
MSYSPAVTGSAGVSPEAPAPLPAVGRTAGSALTIEKRTELMTANEGYARKLARKWAERTVGVDFDDVLQEVKAAMWFATSRYQPERKTKFLTFATPWMNNYARTFCRKATAGGFAVSAHLGFVTVPIVSIGGGEDDGPQLADTRGTDTEPKFGPGWWDRVLSVLPARSRVIIRRYFAADGGPEPTLAAISREHGISRERVRQVVNQGLKKIRKLRPELAELIDV